MGSACALCFGRKRQFDLWYLKDLLEKLLVSLREFLNYSQVINKLLLMIKIGVYHHMYTTYLNLSTFFFYALKSA